MCFGQLFQLFSPINFMSFESLIILRYSGEKTICQPPIVQVFTLKEMKEVAN